MGFLNPNCEPEAGIPFTCLSPPVFSVCKSARFEARDLALTRSRELPVCVVVSLVSSATCVAAYSKGMCMCKCVVVVAAAPFMRGRLKGE